MDVERTHLPGIGLRHEFTTSRGRRVGVISHRTGRREVVVYDREDPDTAAVTLTLSAEEADALADLLSHTRIVEGVSAVDREVVGLVTRPIPLEPNSRYEGRPMGDTRARTRTGASIVAVVRGPRVVTSPRPDFVFEGGDVVVVVGDTESTEAVATLLQDG
jgi:TrkA domain protein